MEGEGGWVRQIPQQQWGDPVVQLVDPTNNLTAINYLVLALDFAKFIAGVDKFLSACFIYVA